MEPNCCGSAAPSGLTVQVCFPGARAAVLDNLNRQREEGRLCDLSIQVQGQVFKAHRCVLAASSPYFHDQVLLKNVTTVSLPSVMDPVAFESVLSSAYTGQLSIVHDDIVNYVTVASFLQMWHIVDKCTEILKRPRLSGEATTAPPGSASRQQSPSSTDCLYTEREARRRDRRPDALPPLATWRRPQQLGRWGRPRPPSELHSADSQLDGLQSYVENKDFSCCDEAWASNQNTTSSLGPDGAGQNSRHHGAGLGGDGLKQKVKLQLRGAERRLEKTRESDESQEGRRTKTRGTEADEGVGEEERKEAPMDFLLPDPEERLSGRQSLQGIKEKVQRGSDGGDASSDPSGPDEVPGRVQWQTGSWAQMEQRPQGGDDEEEEEEEDVDFECLTDSTFSRDTYDEIEDGTGQVSQRSLVSPDFSLGGSVGTWTSTGGGPGASLTAASSHVSPSAAAFPPSPPTPSSSSSASLSGPAYTGKVHFCHCGKAYTLKSMRDRHVKMQHLNLRPFGCPVCTKSFKMKHHLTKHLKTHGGLRPYECGLCGKKVVWRDSFLRHQARCQRLAATGNTAAPDGFGFDEGDLFVPTGAVKLEQGDFHRDGRTGGPLDESGMGRSSSQNLDSVRHVFKEEAAESFTGS
ncbi:zinc finger and BTB domain-containing protein 22 [Nematolebias whitei]|uniref:zinc finger and BTB domain-containing protein 22 n=1 Tax=Nematolebias whitei TaxID=451745 RepID=UPI00189A4A84|nr:zinc finger and BTB domain-containing protein 22 [Nematolebias whitei]